MGWSVTGVTPGGMSAHALAAIENAILRNGYSQIGVHSTRHGDVYMCEKFCFHEDGYYWDLIWACRDGAQHLYCNRYSDRLSRTRAAVDVALEHAQMHNRVFDA